MRPKWILIAAACAALLVTTAVYAGGMRVIPDDECGYCHNMMKGAFVHEPAAVMGCSVCHEPHGTETRFANRLKDKGNDLCFQCHRKIQILVKGKGHPVSRHPVLGWRDPLYPEKKLTCVSCHNPHSSPSARLFRYDYGKYTPFYEPNCKDDEKCGGACYVCHWKSVGTPGAFQQDLPVPDWKTGR